MKTKLPILLFAVSALIPVAGSGQSGSTCATAIPMQLNAGTTQHVLNGPSGEKWFRFTASATHAVLRVEGPSYGSATAHVHAVELYSACGGSPIATASLQHAPGQDAIVVHNTAPLTPGASYRLRVRRHGSTVCPSAACAQSQALPFKVEAMAFALPPVPPPTASDGVDGFEPNGGQVAYLDGRIAQEVLFSGTGPGPRPFILRDRVGMVWVESAAPLSPESSLPGGPHRMQRLDLVLQGGRPVRDHVRLESRPGHTNHYLAHCPDGVTGIKTYGRIVAPNVWNGVDVHYLMRPGGMRMQFVLAPGTDPGRVRIRWEGSDSVWADASGGLHVRGQLGQLDWEAPLVRVPGTNGQLMPTTAQAAFTEAGRGQFQLSLQGGVGLAGIVVVEVGPTFIPTGPTSSIPEWGTFYTSPMSEWTTDLDVEGGQLLHSAGTGEGIGFLSTVNVVQSSMQALVYV